MRKRMMAGILAVVMVLATSITAFAGTWKQDAKGWQWDYGNGTKAANKWEWCDGNGDGIAECYYFDNNGYCLINTTTPDGYPVNGNGAWTEDGVVQTKEVNVQPASKAVAGNSNAGSASSASAGAVLSGKMNGTYHVTSTIPWESRWETLTVSNPMDWYAANAKDGMISDYKYAITLTSAKDGRGSRMLSRPGDGISYQDIGGQCFKDVYHLIDDPTLTFIDSNTFTLDIPDLRPESWDYSIMRRPTVQFTWTKVQ